MTLYGNMRSNYQHFLSKVLIFQENDNLCGEVNDSTKNA